MFSARLETSRWKCTIVPGQKCGIEHAIHSLHEAFNSDESETVLQIDAKNAFTNLNRQQALIIIQNICTYTLLYGTHTTSHRNFSWKENASQEGTTQGDPLEMAM